MTMLKVAEGNPPAPTPGQILNDVSRLLRRKYEQQLKLQHVGLTFPQSRVIHFLARQEGVNQATLAQALDMEPITLVRVIDRLEAAKLVERRRDPQDRRAWILYLTPQSRQLTERISTIGNEIWNAALASLDQPGRDMLIALLTQLKTSLAVSLSRDADDIGGENPGEIDEVANG
jgi:DNA-binding MarR family transcriptional regulator